MQELQVLIEQQQKQIEKQSQQQTTFSSTQRINDLDRELQEKSNIIEEITYRKNFLESQQQNNVREMNDLRQKITQYQLINEQLNEQIDQLINDQEQVKLEHEQKMIDYQNSVRRQISTFHNNSVDLLDQVDQLNKQNQENKQQILKLSQQLREREYEIQRQQQDFLQQQNYYQELQVAIVNENNQLKSQLHQMEIELQNVKFKDNQSVTNLTASQELKFKHLYEAIQEKENKTNQMNKELQHQLVLYDKQAKTLQNRITHLEDEIKQQQEKESINYESTVTFHQPEEVQQLHGQNIKLTSQVQMFSSQHFLLEKQLNEYDEKVKYLQFRQENEIKKLTEEHNQRQQQLSDQLNMSKKDIKDLQNKLGLLTQQYQDQNVQNEKLQKQNQQLSQQILNQQKDINTYNQQANEKLESANQLNQQLLKQISQLNIIRQQDQDEIRKLSTQIKQLQDQQGNYQNQIRLLQNQLNDINQDSTLEQNEIADLKKTINQLINENEILKSDGQNFKFDQSNQLRQQIRQLTQQNEIQKQEIIILKQQITSEQNTNQNEIQNYRRQIEKLQNQLKQGRNEISNPSNKQMDQITLLQTNLQQVQKSLRDQEEQNRNLQRQLNILQNNEYQQKQKQKKRALKDKIIELQQQLSNSQKDYSLSEKGQSGNLVKFYDKEIEEKQRLINSLEEQFKILQKGYEDQDQEIKLLEEENSKLKYQSDNYQNELAILRINQNLSLNPNITINNLNIQQENKILELKIQKLTTQLDELNLKLQDSENDLADMIENYKQEQQKNKQLELNLRNSKLPSKDIENQYRQMILKEFPIYGDQTLEQMINLLILNAIPNRSSQRSQQFVELQQQNQEMLEEIQVLVEKIKSQDIEYNQLQEQLQQSGKQNSVRSANHSYGMSNDFEKDKKIIELENKLALLASENSRLNHIKNQQHKKLQSQQFTQQDIQNY
ncbi:unnamed protein product (macronuclear) [Paramecium tetraurelia]|uniref:GRIP domain-containing protein n=1 Tax=Paramecium tetraurelia TaxID=5888 RepID=A0D7Y1_PARTE|nr:uncharacterized protein GSPATT00014115001 [Paramecium tetraurelia]CAK79148.1 unnamed protein product [Paramecium tetraurelia]|eukprot:XP_001446545.1 hypothetical protein (macronuclear) [Paramecium tetraurelia strain d4-2]